MPPKKDIRSFFKPAEKPTQTNASQKDVRASQRTSPEGKARPTNAASSTGSRITAPPAQTNAPRRASSIHLSREDSTSSRPSNSQTSMASNASKKAVQNGVTVILNSDSDSDLDLDEELDFGLKPVLRKSPRKDTTTSPQSAVRPLNMLGSRTYLRGKGETLRKPPPIKNPNNKSLSKLLQTVKKDAEKEARIAAFKAEMKKADEDAKAGGSAMNGGFSANLVDDDEGGDRSKRLQLAMERTNALGSECVFHFLGEATEERTSRPSFPIRSLPRHQWAACFEEPNTRDQLFLSGFAQQVFEHQTLPEELSRWVMDQICSNGTNGLTPKYIELLEAHPKHLEKILGRHEVDNLFMKMGANLKCLDKGVRPLKEHLESPKRPIPPQLKPVLDLIRSAARWLSPESRKHTLLILLHLCFDDSVLANAGILHNVQEAIESVLRYMPDRHSMLNNVVQTLLSHITNPILQNLLVTSLPLKSPMTASFRRHLALAFIIHPTPLTVTLPNANISSLIHDTLDTSKHFKINRYTDHSSLAASVSLLDIAIGPGLTEVPYRPPPIEDESPNQFLSAEEVAFNKQIDVLVQHIRLMGNNIVEAGAISDPSRLVAKGNMEALCHRLENAARIGGRRKRKIFGGDDYEVMVKSRKIFGQWMGKKKSRSVTPTVDGTPEVEGVKTEVGAPDTPPVNGDIDGVKGKGDVSATLGVNGNTHEVKNEVVVPITVSRDEVKSEDAPTSPSFREVTDGVKGENVVVSIPPFKDDTDATKSEDAMPV